MDKKKFKRSISFLVVIFLMVTISLRHTIPVSADSQGTSAWYPYTYSNGKAIMDAAGEKGISPPNSDISSGLASGTGTLPSVYLNSDGTNVYFRLRVAGNPSDPTKGGFSSAYMIAIGINGTQQAVVGLDGKSSSTDTVYVTNADGSVTNIIYSSPDGNTKPFGTNITQVGTEYFVDFQVPISCITALVPAITAATPVQLFYGTSQAANLSVINKDFMTGAIVDFTGLAVVTMSDVTAHQLQQIIQLQQILILLYPDL